MSFPVKWFSSAMEGAPVLSAAAGAGIAVLDACLLTGFGLRTDASLTVTDEVATVTFASAHAYLVAAVIEVAGATTLTGCNGEQRVTWVNSSSLKFDAPGVADGTASGTITVKIPGSGTWAKSFASSGKGMYKSTAPGATGIYLRVDDSNTATGWNTGGCNMRVAQVVNPTDFDTWTEGWALSTAIIRKSDATTGTAARNWLLLTDGYYFHLFTRPSTTGARSLYGHGDIVSWRPGDQYHCLTIIGNNTNAAGYGANNTGVLPQGAYRGLARDYNQGLGTVNPLMYGSSASTGLGYGGFPYPSLPDNSLLTHAPILVGLDASGPRGIWPGVLQILQTVAGFTAPQILTELSGVAGWWLAYPVATTTGSGTEGTALFDLTGPWR